VADANHFIENSLDGAQKMVSDLVSSCVTPTGNNLNFGDVNVGSTAPNRTLTYTFLLDVTLSAVNILTAGTPNLDYKDGGGDTCIAGTSYTGGQNCMVNVSFAPSAPGVRSGAVKLYAKGQNLPLATKWINGTGEASEVTIDPGTQTSLGSLSGTTPAGVAIDGAGNAYVSDSAGGQVLEIAAGTQTRTTVISGLNAPKGLAIDGGGNLYIANSGSGQVVVVPSEQGTLNAADQYTVGSALVAPYGVAVDGAGDVYIADYAAGQIVEVAANGTQSAPVTGLTSPAAVAVDGEGDLVVAYDSNLVSYYPPRNQTGTPVGSGFENITGVSLDPSGTIYVADEGAGQVYEVSPAGVQTTLATAGLSQPNGVEVCATNVYIPDASGALYQVNRALPTTLIFPDEQIGNASPAQAVTVSNVGNQQLNESALSIPTNFIQVPSGRTDCLVANALNASLMCQIAIEFDPTGTGSNAGYVTLTDNALNNPASTQSVAVSGNGAQNPQTITFTVNAPGSAIYATSFIAAATASSGLTVAFTASGVCSVVDNGNGTASYTMNSGTGTCTVIANQAGNGGYQAAPQVTESTAAALAAPTVTFTGAPATAAFHARFMVNATTNASTSAAITARGVCSIISGGTNTATVKMTSGTGICTLTATWAADNNYTAASASQSTTAVKAATRTAIASTPNPSTEGESVKFSTTVDSVNQGSTYPTGTVTFKTLSGKFTQVVTLSEGAASFSTSELPVGTTKFEAVYSGDANFAASTSTVLTQMVNQ
jgi:sugar lactone lactonase YvrE